MNNISPIIFSNHTKNKINEDVFIKIIEKTIKNFPELNNKKISLNLINEKEMKLINKDYKDKKGLTDTITFAFNETDNFPGENIFGEIFLCIPYIQKKAKEENKDFYSELNYIFTHSLLHLLGFDHQTKAQEKLMHQKIKNILNR